MSICNIALRAEAAVAGGRSWLAAAAAAVVAGLVSPQGLALAGDSGPETFVVGSVVLHSCEGSGAESRAADDSLGSRSRGRPDRATDREPTRARWCGMLSRPLGSAEGGGSVSIYFEFYPHTGPQPAVSTLVATEGGPGYPATESRDEYLELFQPLRERRDVVLMDNRGTGQSGAIDCRPLQTDPTLSESSIGQCGRSLGANAAAYSTVRAADDLEAILQALGSGVVDLYGDSYGTFFEQVFALRHPERLRSLILDGAYPLGGPGYAWYPDYAPAMRAKFETACQRSADCKQLPGTVLERVGPALESLRRAPVAAEARDGDARLQRFTANTSELAIVMFGSAPAYATLRETDAAARAYVAGDRAPLFRLMAEARTSVDSRDEARSPGAFSAGLAAAVMCEDAQQIFDMSLDPSRRVIERETILADQRRAVPGMYAPFTIDEFRGMPLDYAYVDQCVSWPAVPDEQLETMERLRASRYPDVPALVISGDLDNITPLSDGAAVAMRFVRGRQLVVPNGFHVNALRHSRSACPAEIARRFVETLDVGNTECLHDIPEVRVLPAFARHVRELSPAVARPGNGAGREQLQVVTAVVRTVGDAIARIASNSTGHSAGLRGGMVDIGESATGGSNLSRTDVTRLALHEVRWTEDLVVSGVVVSPRRGGDGTANLVVSGADGVTGTLKISWREGMPGARAIVRGTLGKSKVVAETVAP